MTLAARFRCSERCNSAFCLDTHIETGRVVVTKASLFGCTYSTEKSFQLQTKTKEKIFYLDMLCLLISRSKSISARWTACPRLSPWTTCPRSSPWTTCPRLQREAVLQKQIQHSIKPESFDVKLQRLESINTLVGLEVEVSKADDHDDDDDDTYDADDEYSDDAERSCDEADDEYSDDADSSCDEADDDYSDDAERSSDEDDGYNSGDAELECESDQDL